MSHKYVTAGLIKALEEDVRGCDSSINRIKLISRGGTEGKQELISQLRDFLETARQKKDQGLDLMMQNGAGALIDPIIQEKSSLLCRGQEKAFEIVLDMLENPERAIQYYAQQKEEYEKKLAQYRAAEQRPD